MHHVVTAQQEQTTEDALSLHFEPVAAILRDLDIDQMWREATESERRFLVDELVEEVAVFSDHLEVKVAGAPRINVTLAEVGLKVSDIGGIGEPTRTFSYQGPLAA